MNPQHRIAFAILGSAVIIAGAIAYAGIAASSDVQRGSSPAVAPAIGDDPFIGSPSAPLTLYYWRDFQCPFCKQFDTETLPALVSEYVNTGKLRIVFKDFVFLGPGSAAAAVMSHAAWDAASSSYYPWQDAIFSAQGSEGSGWATQKNLLAITDGVSGMNASAIAARMADNATAYQAAVAADRLEAQTLGIQGTPGFWLDGQTFTGAQPLGFFEQIINADLAQHHI